MRRRLALALICAAVLHAAACGSSDQPSSSSTAGAPAASSAGSASGPSGASGATTSTGGPASSVPAGCPPEGGTAKRVATFTAAPPMCIDPNRTYRATVTTDVGAFTVDLDAKKAPKTVNNFVFLARNHFYDGVTFHRVIQGFMAQGGDPDGTGSGGPGYEFADELPQAGEYKVGSVAMANVSRPDTNGSQFFVITGEAGVQLPPQYSLFGQVTSGMDVVKKIEADGSPGDGPPAKVHAMKTVTIAQS